MTPDPDSLRQVLGRWTPDLGGGAEARARLAQAIEALYDAYPHPTRDAARAALPEEWRAHPDCEALVAAILTAGGERTA